MLVKRSRILIGVVIAALPVAACGSSIEKTSGISAPAPVARADRSSTADAPPMVSELKAAERPELTQFPKPEGRTLRQLSHHGKFLGQLGASTGTFTPGIRRYAFGVNAASGKFIYAPTAIYIARSSSAPAEGPFLAPADPMSVPPQFRGARADAVPDLQAIYATQVPLQRPGVYQVLALTHTPRGLIASENEIAIGSTSPIPNVGDRPPAIATDTLRTVHGDVTLLTTREPPENMHSMSFKRVLGKRPVALLFSTPALCISKICGPVTDIMVSLQHEFAGRITFIHQEVYVNNDPTKGLRPQMRAFHLETEPWLFTINRRGIIATRLEGAFGVHEARAALEAALR